MRIFGSFSQKMALEQAMDEGGNPVVDFSRKMQLLLVWLGKGVALEHGK